MIATPQLQKFCKEFGIGLTGGIATGKSTVAKIIASHGFAIIDADQLARDVVTVGSPALSELKKEFGDQIILPDGTLDRAGLRSIVFSDASARKRLEAITHPRIYEELTVHIDRIFKKTQTHSPRFFFYEATLIFENNTQDRFHSIWCTDCSRPTQIQRLLERGNMSEKEAKAIIQAQLPSEQKKKYSQVLIDTEQPLTAVRKNVEAHLKNIQK